MEAQANGYVEAVALGTDGMVSEGSGQNLFVVRDGELCTPPINGSNLSGLTRRSILQIAEAELGLKVRIEPIPRGALRRGRALLPGTATEVMPIRSLDKIKIGREEDAAARSPNTCRDATRTSSTVARRTSTGG